MRRAISISLLLLLLIGCTMTQLRFWRSVGERGERFMDSPLVDATPLGPIAGLLGALFGIVRNVTESRIRAKGGDSKVPTDNRNIISKLSGSKKYMTATIISAILIAVVKYYKIEIEPDVIAKIIAGLFGLAIAGNALEDFGEKRKS